ncbi:MAG: YlxR family protein [Oscillospiraceae bacterium]|nr:YlxR family protein [Oscillospiraceae bacterium]
MKQKKIPQRKCMGCGEMFNKNELVRVVKSRIKDADGEQYEISLDLTGKKSGRGAYVCKKSECLQKARKARRLERSLDCTILDEVYDRMEQELRNDEQ